MARPPHVQQPGTELEEFFDLSIDPLSIIGFDGEFKRVNAAFVRLVGYPKPELLARTALDILHPDDVAPAREALAQLANGHDLVGFEARVICAGGSERWLEWNTRSVPERGVVYSVGRDTTERRRVYAELRDAQRSLEASLDEQAALRRTATLVAQEAPLQAVFTTVAEEVARTLGDVDSALWRDNGDGTTTAVAVRGPSGAPGVSVGTRLSVEGDSVIATVLREGRPHQVDDYSRLAGSIAERARELGLRSAVGCPVVVGSRTWGTMTVATYGSKPFPPETATRVARFSELVATAIANAEARAEVERLAEVQAALRRVATLVAEGASPSAVLDAVAAEMEQALGADAAMLLRYEPGEEATVVAGRVPGAGILPVGTRFSHEGDNVTAMVRRTGRPARFADYERARGAVAELARAVELDVSSAVGAPIVIEGRLWGVILASWGGDRSPPGDAEERMAKFAQMLETAIANADSRDQLISSRARLLTAGDEARRRVVRDLHDGAQQRLVHTIATLKLAKQALEDGGTEAESLVDEALAHAQQGNAELRELAHGILPGALTRGGLRAGLETVVQRLDLPVEVDVPVARFPSEIEASAYFIVAEALTNVVKHAHAGRAEVTASLEDTTLRIEVRDNGAGGADPEGHGLVGMRDRVTTLGGRLEIDSPAGAGTRVAATLPLSAG